MSATYRELLKHPKWQKRRLQMLEAAEWKCARCSNTERTLHVHHECYVNGRKPWEYDDSELRVLCELCHENEHLEQKQLATFDMVHGAIWDSYGDANDLEMESLYKCPVCNFEYVHFEAAEYFDVDDYSAPWQGRGSCLRIPMWGECGHEWYLIFGFHKGWTYQYIVPRDYETNPKWRVAN